MESNQLKLKRYIYLRKSIIPSIIETNLNGFVLLNGVCNGAYVKDP